MVLENNYSLENFDPEVLREYDIRGIINETLIEEDAYLIGKGFCSLNSDNNIKSIFCRFGNFDIFRRR